MSVCQFRRNPDLGIDGNLLRRVRIIDAADQDCALQGLATKIGSFPVVRDNGRAEMRAGRMTRDRNPVRIAAMLGNVPAYPLECQEIAGNHIIERDRWRGGRLAQGIIDDRRQQPGAGERCPDERKVFLFARAPVAAVDKNVDDLRFPLRS